MPAAAHKDHYETLGVGRKAAADEIRKAYRRLARKHHPDLNPGDKSAEDRFKKIQEAYDILSDAKKRRMYDQYGFYSEHGPPPGAGPKPGQAPHFDFSGFDFSEMFQGGAGAGRPPRPGPERREGFGDNLRDVFSQFFSGREAPPAEQAAARGEDLEYEVPVGFWDAIRGTTRRLSVQRYDQCTTCGGNGASARDAAPAPCPECQGTGNVTQAAGAMRFQLGCPRCGGTGKLRKACRTCHGEGRLLRPDSIEVRIPPGTQSGSRLRIAAKGNASSAGGPPGDLYIIIRAEEHPIFRRERDDIHITVPITITEASLGAKIGVPTIDGRAMLDIPAGTQSGQKFRVRDRGVHSSRTGTRGDQYVEVQVHVPKVADERSRELLRELERLHPSDPRTHLFVQE